MAYLRFHVTSLCNFSCKYCHVYKINEKLNGKKIISFQIMNKSILLMLNEMLKKNDDKLIISFYGGEPLLAKDNIYKIINKFKNIYKNINIRWILNTNGSLITKNDVLFFKKNNVDVHISCDGFENTHNKNRIFKNKNKTFKYILNSFKLFKKEKLDFQINSLVTKENVYNLKEIVDLAYKFNCKRIYLDWFYTNEKNKIDVDLIVNSYISLFYYAKKRKIAINGPWSKILKNFQLKCDVSERFQNQLYIEVNFDGSFFFGFFPLSKKLNLTIDYFQKILNSKKYVYFLKQVKNYFEKNCNKCSLKLFCYGEIFNQYNYHTGKEDTENCKYYCLLLKKTINFLVKKANEKNRKVVQVNVSYKCNKDCSYCYAKPLVKKYDDLSVDNFTKLCNWLKINNIYSINITGGEPTINLNLFNYINIAKKYDIKVNIFSNGLFDKNIIQKLGDNVIGFLINYNNQSHYKKKEWKLLHTNLVELKKNKINFNLMFNINNNTDSYDYILDVCEKYNLNDVIIELTIPNSFKTNDYISHKNLKTKIKFCVDIIKKLKDKGIFCYISRPIPPCFFTKKDYDFLINNNDLVSLCFSGQNIVSVNPDLTIHPCLSLFVKGPKIISFSNFMQIENFYKNSIENLKWKKTLFEKCKKCMFFIEKKCQGSCLCRKIKGFEIIDKKNFILYTQYKKADCYEFIKKIEKAFLHINNYFSIKKMIEIYNFDNNNDLLIFSNVYFLPKWARAFVSRGVYYQQGLNIDFEGLIHELTHIYLDELCVNLIPSWLNEGICEYVAYGNLVDMKLKKLLLKKKLIPFKKMDGLYNGSLMKIDDSFPDENIAYQQSASLVKFIIDKYGMDLLIKFLKTKNSNFYNLFKLIFQKDFFDVERDWLKKLKIN